jgi:hypothetical protein
MVRRFVEEQHVRATEDDAAQRDAPALTSGEMLEARLGRGQTQRFHRDVDARVEVPGVRGFDAILQGGLLLEQARHRVVRHFLAQLHADGLELGDE